MTSAMSLAPSVHCRTVRAQRSSRRAGAEPVLRLTALQARLGRNGRASFLNG